MRYMLLATLCLLHFDASAQLRSQPSVPFAANLELAKSAELDLISKVSEGLKAGDRSLCRHDRKLSVSACALRLIRTYRIHSAQSLRGLIDLSVSAAVIDRNRGLSEMQTNSELAANFIAIAENVRPEKFFAIKMHARTKQDRLEKTQARITENAALESFRAQVVPVILSKMTKVNSLALRARAEKLRGRRWALR
jgi:hypothetical protein